MSASTHPRRVKCSIDRSESTLPARAGGKGGHQGDDDGIRVSTEQHHPDVGTADLGIDGLIIFTDGK